MEYLPFGETLTDEHTNSFNSPFKYNGKEFDEETGNYYYSARYYDPKWSIFISVDPLAEKTMDAYGYCYQNPINFVDPTGMSASDGDDWFKNNLTGEATYIPGATMDTPVSGYTYMCEECAKYDMPFMEQPANPFEGNVLYEANGNKLPLMPGIVIGDPLYPPSNEHGNGGLSMGISIGGAVGGGIGMEVGVVKDFATNNWGLYFSFKSHVGFGGALGVNGTIIEPQSPADFKISDFSGTGLETSVGFNTPLGGAGYTYGGSSPEPGKGIIDRYKNIGKNKDGYRTGGISPEILGPSPKLSVGAITTKSKTWVLDF